jgi:hypothetical protein
MSQVPMRRLEITLALEEAIRNRLDWLRDRQREMRRAGGPDFMASDLRRGRVQGQIGELEWLLQNGGCRPPY